MGMFDTVRCEYPLPNPADNVRFFQTKDLERTLARYTITKDGRLIEHTFRSEVVPEEERPYYNTPGWPDLAFVGSSRAIDTGDEEVSYDGVLSIHDIATDAPDAESWCARTWVEYALLFEAGRVRQVTDKSHPLEPARSFDWAPADNGRPTTDTAWDDAGE